MSEEEPGDFWRPPRATATADAADYPALLDAQQWTQAATFSQDDIHRGPSARIGRYYRPRFDELSREELEVKAAERTKPVSPLRPTVERTGWAAGLPFKGLLPAGAAPPASPPTGLPSPGVQILGRQIAADEAAAEAMTEGTHRQLHLTDPEVLQQRFDAYVEHGVDDASLAPFRDEWASNAMAQVPRELAGVPPKKVERLVNEMLDEVQQVRVRAFFGGRPWPRPLRDPHSSYWTTRGSQQLRRRRTIFCPRHHTPAAGH